MRGHVLPKRQHRRHRSTRRRQDTPDLPRRAVAPVTIGKTYTAPDGTTYRPSMFLTLTCPSYGRVNPDGTPADPDRYDYQRAARDALHFAALFDRFIQNLRRFLGYDVQYFAAIEPQRRLAPHVHVAIRGAISRAELRQVLAATYHQVWWPTHRPVKHDDATCRSGTSPPAATSTPPPGSSCPPGTRPWTPSATTTSRCTWSGSARFDAQGVLAGSRDASPVHRLPHQYLTKHVADCHQATTDAQHDHAERLADALRYEPCSPTCANWLRYGIQPSNPREGLRPGRCTGKAHRREYLGYAGRRVLVSRKWSGKTLADHRADRKAWLLETLGLPQPTRPATPGSPSPPATPTTCRPPSGSCTSSPTASDGTPRSPKPGQSQRPDTRRSFGNREGGMSAARLATNVRTHAGGSESTLQAYTVEQVAEILHRRPGQSLRAAPYRTASQYQDREIAANNRRAYRRVRFVTRRKASQIRDNTLDQSNV